MENKKIFETTNQYIIDTNMEPVKIPTWSLIWIHNGSHHPNVRKKNTTLHSQKTPQNMYNTYPHKKCLQHTVY